MSPMRLFYTHRWVGSYPDVGVLKCPTLPCFINKHDPQQMVVLGVVNDKVTPTVSLGGL